MEILSALFAQEADRVTNGILLLCKVVGMKSHAHLSTPSITRIKLPSISVI